MGYELVDEERDALTKNEDIDKVDLVDRGYEARIIIQPDGQAVLNEQALDAPDSRTMPELVAVLKRFKESADNAKSEALVTVAPFDTVRHQRIVDVLNACAEAKITGVTLADGGGGEGE